MRANIINNSKKNVYMEKFKKSDRVRVSASATGLGKAVYGTVTAATTFMGEDYVDVRLDMPLPNGREGIVISNLRMIEKLNP